MSTATTIGQTIRRLRKERNLTQEELAQQLNITSQAVSRWESETGLPDISQIVPLANVFGVSTDVLFGTFGVDNEEEVKKIIEDSLEPEKTAYTKEQRTAAREYRYERLQEGLKTYPNNVELLSNVLSNGVCMLDDSHEDTEEGKEKRRAIYAECERAADVILNNCKDISTLLNTRGWLVHLYMKTKEYEKAKEQAEFLPGGTWGLRGGKLARVQQEAGELDEAVKTRCNSIFSYLRELEMEIMWLSQAYSEKGQIEEAYTSARMFYEMMDIVYEKYTYRTPFFLNHPYQKRLAIWAMKLGRPEEAMDWLERMYRDQVATAENWEKGIISFDIPLFSGIDTKMVRDAYYAKPRILFAFDYKIFDPIRETERFQTLLAKVNALPDAPA